MNNQEKLSALLLKLTQINAKKVELDDIPDFVECRVAVYMLCSKCWFEEYYYLRCNLEKSIEFLQSQILLDDMLALDVSLI